MRDKDTPREGEVTNVVATEATIVIDMSELIFYLKQLGILPDMSPREICLLALKDFAWRVAVGLTAIAPIFFLGFNSTFSAPEQKTAFFLVWTGICFLSGGLMNQTVIWTNGGKMHVITTRSKVMKSVRDNDKTHAMATSDTKYKLLCDWIDVWKGAVSLGDMFIGAGEVAMFFASVYATIYVASYLIHYVVLLFYH